MIRVADMFSGLGGFSEAARLAGAHVVWAGNHWRDACEWHERNHGLKPACQDMHLVPWEDVPPHDLLLASWACQGFTPAKGNRTLYTDQQRATAWAVITALEFHRPEVFIGENVPAFERWELFPVWRAAVERLGYSMTTLTLNAADSGVPQERVRLFIVGTRSRHPIQLTMPQREHVPVNAVIDWHSGGWSQVEKPRRAHKTLARVLAGRFRYGHRFVMPYYSSGSGLTGRSVDRPIGTITTRARWAIVDGDRMRMLNNHEARACMGFHAGYRIPESPKLAMHLLGNAVCPPQGCDVIRAVKEAA